MKRIALVDWRTMRPFLRARIVATEQAFRKYDASIFVYGYPCSLRWVISLRERLRQCVRPQTTMRFVRKTSRNCGCNGNPS